MTNDLYSTKKWRPNDNKLFENHVNWKETKKDEKWVSWKQNKKNVCTHTRMQINSHTATHRMLKFHSFYEMNKSFDKSNWFFLSACIIFAVPMIIETFIFFIVICIQKNNHLILTSGEAKQVHNSVHVTISRCRFIILLLSCVFIGTVKVYAAKLKETY